MSCLDVFQSLLYSPNSGFQPISWLTQDQLKRSPLREMPGGREKLAAENENAKMGSSHNSNEFMKMYSPMADKMAEAARNSNNGRSLITLYNS